MTYKNVKTISSDLTPVTESSENSRLYTGSYSDDYIAYSSSGTFKFYKLYFYATASSTTNGYYKDITNSLRNGDILIGANDSSIKFIKVTQAKPTIDLVD